MRSRKLLLLPLVAALILLSVAPAAAATCTSPYTVLSGNTLYRIGLNCGVSVSALMSANGLTSTLIRIGQQLILPGAPMSSVPEPVSVPSTPTSSATEPASSPSKVSPERLVLANYFVWYDESLWGQSATWDVPTIPYNSDQRSTIERHVGWAQQAGLDGFAVHWYLPGNRTDTNLRTLLDVSPTNFRSSVTVVTNTLPGMTRQTIVDSLHYLLSSYGQHSNFLRLGGKPVLYFTDMTRVPLEGTTSSLASWQSIRDEVDPGRTSIWIAEGLDPSYMTVFDGLYVYKVNHACCPGSYNKAARWAGWVDYYERITGQSKLWVGTIQPGWDDTRSVGQPDLRAPSPAFVRERGDGSYYQATFNAATATNPDMLLIHSFNEWIEGSQIEPGSSYGDLYLNLTAQFVAQYKSQ